MSISIELDRDHEDLLRRRAAQEGKTEAAVALEILEQGLTGGHPVLTGPMESYWEGYIGVVDGSSAALSEHTGEQFAELLEKGRAPK